VNIGSIAILQAFVAGFTGLLQANGYIQIPVADVSRGQLSAIIQWGYYPIPQVGIPLDTQYSVTWPIRFPNMILTPPLATNVYFQTGGRNTAASAVSWNPSGGVFILDVPNSTYGAFNGNEKSNGFSWLAIGF
jgi:hypothetical protein